jgi:hypothetical protein
MNKKIVINALKEEIKTLQLSKDTKLVKFILSVNDDGVVHTQRHWFGK